MATGRTPARSSRTKGAATKTVKLARVAANGKRLARTWRDVTLPAAGVASLYLATGTVPADVVVTSAQSPFNAFVAVVGTGAAARSVAVSDHAKSARERRRIERTFRRLGFMEPPSALHPQGRLPRMLPPEPTRAGSRVRVQIPSGASLRDLAEIAPALERNLGKINLAPAAPPPSLAARTVARARRVTPGVEGRDPLEQMLEYGWFELNIRRREALAGRQLPWEHLAEMRALGFAGRSVWDGWHVAMDEDGEPVHLTLTQRNLLTGGEPGGGKSAGLHVVCGGIALDPTARMFVVDPSGGVELGQWEDVAEVVAEDAEQAVDLLVALHEEMCRRLAFMKATREERRAAGLPARNVAPGEETIWVVVDELLALTNHADKDVRTACNAMLMKIVGQGRKVGFHLVASTLRPTGDVIPTSLRDLIQFKQAYKCTTADASQAILGGRWAALGYGGHMVNGKVLGVNYLLAQGEPLPRRTRGTYLTEAELDEVAAVGARLRREAGVRPLALGGAPRVTAPALRAPAKLAAPASVAVEPEPAAPPSRDTNRAEAAKRVRRNRPGQSRRRLHAVGTTTPKEGL